MPITEGANQSGRSRPQFWACSGLVLLAALLVAGVPATDRWLVQPAFERLERKQALDDAWRVSQALRGEADKLVHMLGDWANWDDSYRFAVTRDPEFVRANLGDWKVFEQSTTLNFCIIVDTNRTVIYQQAYDSDMGGEVHLRDAEGDDPDLVRRLAFAARPGRQITGVVETDRGLLAIAAHPLMTTSGEGPSHGFIALGRFIDAALVRDLVDRTRISFALFPIRKGLLTPEEDEFIAGLRLGLPGQFSLPDGRSYVYELLADFENAPVAIIRTPVNREVSAVGKQVGRVVVALLLLGLGGLAGVLVLLFLIGGGPISRQSRLALGYEQVSREARRRNLVWMASAVAIYILGVAGYAIWTGRHAETEILATLDQRLLAVARSQRYLLPRDYHDRATAPRAIGIEEEKRLRAIYNDYARASDVTHLYTIAPYGTSLVFTATSIKESEEKERESWYFFAYNEAPPAFRDALDGQREVLASYTDQRGHFRSAIVPQVSPGGRHYLACADYDISQLSTAVGARMLTSALVAMGFLALALPFVLAYRKSFTSLTANLTESEASYRGLFDTVEEAIYILDEQGAFITVNRGAETMYGHPREWFVGRTPADLAARPDEDLPVAQAAMGRALAGEPQRFPFWGRRANGDAFPKEVHLYRGHYFGRVVVVAVARDNTAHLRAEEERLSMERRVLHGQKLESLGVLAGGIAHDFNNLLLAIMGNLELVTDDVPAHSPARQGLNEAMQASRRAADLTRQMLAYSGRGRFVVQPLDLSEAVAANVNLLRASIAKTATLDLHLDRSLPLVDADASQIQQIVMNLIINASEALGDRPGTITISSGTRSCTEALLAQSRCEEKPPPGAYVFLEVRDNGCGMDADTLQRMFDPFFSTKATGRGLGMSAVLGIVRSHRGAILVDSGPGRGSTFTVLFKARPACDAVAPVEAPPVAQVAASLPRGLLLVVDDEVALCDVACRMVERLGFTSLRAFDGAQAVAVFKDHHHEITAVLMDLSMPNMDGVDAYHAMVKIRPDIPVVLTSGFSEQDAVARFEGVGLAGFLQKPYAIASLKAALAGLCRPVSPTPPERHTTT